MKLIDLLVQELPKRGGWPRGEKYAWCDDDGEIRFNNALGDFYPTKEVDRTDRSHGIGCATIRISREQYEAAFAASKKVEWDGNGLPPVGCECEYNAYGSGWKACKVMFVSEYTVLVRRQQDGGDPEEAFVPEDIEFRPIRSEADKKRDAAIEWFVSIMPTDEMTETAAGYLYDAIAAGKIPGVKLED